MVLKTLKGSKKWNEKWQKRRKNPLRLFSSSAFTSHCPLGTTISLVFYQRYLGDTLEARTQQQL